MSDRGEIVSHDEYIAAADGAAKVLVFRDSKSKSVFAHVVPSKGIGDKGISVGEKSNVHIDDIKIDQADIGIASKDSSIIKLNKATLKNLRTCVSAYNKKQEFDGGFIKINEIKCENFLKKFDIDSLSKVLTDKDQSKLN